MPGHPREDSAGSVDHLQREVDARRRLLGRKKYAEAEPLLVAGYEGMKRREATIPPQGKPRLTEALERLVQLYEATGRPDEAARWRKELEASKAAAEAGGEEALNGASFHRPRLIQQV